MKKATFDPARNLMLYLRVKRTGTKKFIFVDSNGDAVNVSTYDFELWIQKYSGAVEKIIHLTIGDGLTVSNNELTAVVSIDDTNINEGQYYWELYKGSTDRTYLNGTCILHTGNFDGVTEDEETITINDGNETVTINVGDGVLSASIPLVSFDTVLTFDYDKDLSTVTGGTRTFTLSSLGNKNGVGIVARINDPVAINFPGSFELASGSDPVSTTNMNIIIFRYFEDYDGAGNDKVLYLIKNQS